jgi:hypothetical protein
LVRKETVDKTKEEHVIERQAQVESQKDSDPKKAKLRKYRRDWYRENKDTVISRYQKYYRSEKGKKHRQQYLELYRTVPSNRIRAMVNAAFSRSMDNDWEFDQVIKPILMENPPSHCPCCGVELSYGTGNRTTAASLDRLDATKGYTVGNVFIICFNCNRLKSNATMQDLERIMTYMKDRARADNGSGL